MENQHDDNCCLFTPSIITLTVSAVLIAITRILYILCQSGKPLRPSKSPKPLSTLIVLGSGGHTAEMINVLNVLLQKDRFCPRFYVAAATDNMSLQKAHLLEENVFNLNGGKGGSTQFLQIYRSREVGQSYITSIGTTFLALVHALWLMIRIRPQVDLGKILKGIWNVHGPIQHFMVLAAKNRSKEACANNRSWEQARNEQELPSIYSLCPCWSTFFPIV
ncbi:UDP-N-acetylglucosamine transferase subunit ALG14 [Populus alba x Populus x berolinensis]|uniref:UDP-N-acetylglucosamine transferase subunit ALG14 n=1 Tax=Populus alba x Populus x berolinensis TaxID=444605 RepID=A0AAD6WL72_9ROSI|nr:UDP-N-acetylglucosamine transferase subunit ALG14 [Populus alba x Populus x berolinensis]